MGHKTNYPAERTIERVRTDRRISLLDQERIASMADEGGVSGALMEMEDVVERKRVQRSLYRQRFFTRPRVAAALALAALAVFMVGVRWRSR